METTDGLFFAAANTTNATDWYRNFTHSSCINGTTDCLSITTTQRWPPTPPYESYVTAVLATLAGITSLCTVGGNILVVLAFFLERNIRQPSNYLIASLAITDILIGMFSMPLYTLYLLKAYWPLTRVLCDLWLSLDYTVCLVSQYTVFLITLDRFCSVKVPAKYRNWRTKRKIKVMIATTWLVPTLIFFTSIMGWHKFVGTSPPDDGSCAAQFQTNSLFTAILVISYYWVTLVIMTGLYIGIYQVALRLNSRAQAKRSRMKQMTSQSDGQKCNNRDPQLVDKSIAMLQPSSQRKRQLSHDDSDFSNDQSSDSMQKAQAESSLIHDQSSPNGESDSLWKPRPSLTDVNYDVFNDSSYSTLHREESGVTDKEEQEKLYCSKETPIPIDPPADRQSRFLSIFTKPLRRLQNLKMQKTNNSPRTKSKSENRARKALRTITFILGAFVICWTPYHVVVLIDAFCSKPGTCINGKFYEFSYWLCYGNSPLNPFCYALANQQFKKAFVRILKGDYFKSARCCKKSSSF